MTIHIKRPPVARDSALYADLAKAVGGDVARLVVEEAALRPYAEDFTSVVDKGMPQIVVRASSVEEVQEVLRVANRHRVPVTPWSAGYGLGTSLAPEGGILLELKGMNRILEINPDEMYVLVEPGVTYADLTPLLVEKDLVISVPDAPATVSVLANHLNFGIGAYQMQHGMGPELVLGLEVVLPTGELVRTGSAAREGSSWFARFAYNPIPDLTGIFLGSMGTLGVCTKLAIRVFPRPEKVHYAKVGFGDVGTAARAIQAVSRRGLVDRVAGFSWFFTPRATAILAGRVTGQPLDRTTLDAMRAEVAEVPEVYFFLGIHGSAGTVEARRAEMEAAIGREFGGTFLEMTPDDHEKYHNVANGLTQVQSERAILGAKGKYQGAYGTYVTYTPIANWEGLYEAWAEIAGRYGHPLAMNTKLFGHGRYSSFRFILSYFDQNDEKDRQRITDMCSALEAEALDRGAASGGTTSATLRTLASYELYRRIKDCLDPNGIMHPSMGDWQPGRNN